MDCPHSIGKAAGLALLKIDLSSGLSHYAPALDATPGYAMNSDHQLYQTSSGSNTEDNTSVRLVTYPALIPSHLD